MRNNLNISRVFLTKPSVQNGLRHITDCRCPAPTIVPMSRDTIQPAGSSELTVSDRLRVSTSTRRRLIIDILEDEPTPISLEELARSLAEREDNEASEEGKIERDQLAAIATSLHHIHLPYMDDLGILEYDSASRMLNRVS